MNSGYLRGLGPCVIFTLMLFNIEDFEKTVNEKVMNS